MKLKAVIAAGVIVPSLLLVAAPLAFAQTPTTMGTHVLRAWFQAKITAVNGTTLSVTTKAGANVTVDGSNAKFVRRFGGPSSVSELSVGDSVIVRGTWTDATKTAVTATWIRDVSIQKAHDLFGGTVNSLTSNGFVLTSKARGQQTVIFTSTTKFYGKKKTTIQSSDITAGDRVSVRGLWDRTSKTITADWVRDPQR